ncbi:MAG: hypothetical protein ACK40M_13305 [Flavobacteriales bacterium]
MRSILLVILISLSQYTEGQSVRLSFSSDSLFKVEGIKYKTSFAGENDSRKEIRKVWLQCIDRGYYAASIDSVIKNGNNLHVWFYTGEKYKWGKLKKGNAEEEALIFAGYREKLYRGSIFSSKDLSRLIDRLLKFHEDRGYPFASVKLDSIEMISGIINAKLNVDKKKLFRIDSVIVKGDAKIIPQYLYHWIDVHPGDLYREEVLSNVDVRLREIPFVEPDRPTEIVFTENQCVLILYLRKKRASQFNGIVGVLPDNRTGKILVTGDARIRVRNGFGKGELIDMNWRKLGAQVQDLKLNYDHPFLFRTNFGTDIQFKLFKKDSTFLELKQYLAAQYRIKNGSVFRVYFGNNSTDLLTPTMFVNAQTLPSFADIRTVQYGIGIKAERLDYRLNPSKGYSINLSAGAGTRNIRKNRLLSESLYAGIPLRTNIYNGQSDTEFFIPIKKRSTIRIGNKSGFTYSENLFINELTRIGGFQTIRGFNEEVMFASGYSIGSIEVRYLLDRNSAVFLFSDAAWYERNLKENYFSDTPFGFGAGVFFQTKAGVFNFSYALGSEQGNPLLIRAAKVHFGFVNYF